MTAGPILAATDFSPASHHAIARATALAAAVGAPLELMHVVPSGWLAELRAWLAGNETLADESLEPIRARLEGDARRLAVNGIQPVTRLAEGQPHDEIAARAAAIGASLVVVGAHGRHFVREALVGATALALVGATGAPILMVRQASTAPYRRLVVATDLSPASASLVRAAARFAPDAAITLVHACEDPYAATLFLGQAAPPVVEHYRELAMSRATTALDALVWSLGSLATRITPRVASGPPSLRIVEAVSEPGVDLTVVGVRSLGPLQRAALRSISAHVVLESPTDVLIVPEAMAA